MGQDISESQVRAAEYVRMSTDHQKYSTQNQSDIIRAFAEKRGMIIVQTYSDPGRSGLTLAQRPALKQLLEDVQTGRASFKTILVYDVSRWGRFQDIDESAYYEYVCRRSGVNVEYCAEQFDNDGSPFAAIIKALKRAMAAEYSRELSVKTFAGQSRMVELGFKVGGPPGYGYRRLLVGPDGVPKFVMVSGEQKNLATDRVKLVPGPSLEVDTVRWIFSTFVHKRLSEFRIANALNSRGAPNSVGHRWTHTIITKLLRNEMYIGNNVWNRTSFKLQKARLRNNPEMWIRADGAFEAIIDRSLFDAAQAIFAGRELYTCRSRRKDLSDDEMLEALQRLREKRGYLTVALIDKSRGVPSSGVYQQRFGGLKRAYQLIGYKHSRRYRRGSTRAGRARELSDEQMLDALRQLWINRGHLTTAIINASKSVPPSNMYRLRFGSLFRAYQMIGFKPETARSRARRSPRFVSNEALLDGLRGLLRRRGRLSRKIIDDDKDSPARGTLSKRFGGLLKAFELVGYTPDVRQLRLRRV